MIIAPGPAIPVKDGLGKRLPPGIIRWLIRQALDQARRDPTNSYHVTARGWGYPHATIAPMFDNCPGNVVLPYEFIY